MKTIKSNAAHIAHTALYLFNTGYLSQSQILSYEHTEVSYFST